MLKNLKNNKKKGFTLVELIVVLVILAILAALLIPALTGYIDKAKQKQITAETRQVVMAAQTIFDEQYGTVVLGGTVTCEVIDGSSSSVDTTTTAGTSAIKLGKSEIADLAEVPVANIDTITIDATKGIVTAVTYKENGQKCEYTRTDKTAKGTYKVSKQ